MALLTGGARFDISIKVPEWKTDIGVNGGTSQFLHQFDFFTSYENGTGANKINAVYSSPATAISGATDVDLRASLASVLDGSTVSFPIVVGVFIKNLSTTTGQYITVGAATNPWITWLGASGDAVRVGPGGIFALTSPVDGYATTSGTGDILTLTPATGSPSYSMLIIGRSA